jgi:hypothetical protein
MANFVNNLKETRRIYKEHFAYQQDIRIIKDKHIWIPELKKKLQPAECFNIQEELSKLYTQRRDFYVKYRLLEDKIVHSDHPDSYKTDYNKIVEEINTLQTKINQLHDYYDLVSEPKEPDYAKIEDKMGKLYESMQEDPTLISEYVKFYRKLRSMQQDHAPDATVEYVVLTPPTVETATEDIVVRKEPLVKPKRGQKGIALSNSDVKIIKKNVKQLIKEKFKAQTLEECTSQKRSQPYYMKKEDILNMIESNPELKRILPANYKTLNKENLCKHLYT